jgi:hypothetical protein
VSHRFSHPAAGGEPALLQGDPGPRWFPGVRLAQLREVLKWRTKTRRKSLYYAACKIAEKSPKYTWQRRKNLQARRASQGVSEEIIKAVPWERAKDAAWE